VPNHALSPIAESFVPATSLPAAFTVGRGPFTRPVTPSANNAPSLDDLRRRLIKFYLPDEGHSCTINVADCAGGVEVLEKVLKKFGKGGQRSADGDSVSEHVHTDDGGLIVDGWGVYFGQADGPSKLPAIQTVSLTNHFFLPQPSH
jgi:mitogen-activated protein kinase kinase kinase